ncbi:MAG: ferrous iron transporter B, partial [Bacteroidetes bacterium]|nr:ferrous iron transporter B [Bacteroidota bacterium]
LDRYNAFTPDLSKIIQRQLNASNTFTDKLDNILTHKFWGVLIFFALMLLVFQAMFNWSTIPMDFIDTQFTRMAGNIANNMADSLFTRLLTEGIIPGIGGIVIFVPQIFLLFLIISILEEIGYMSRAVYLFDSLMQRFGLNGRSIVALISGGACAIPAIMSTRTISNPKERLITILITPFISCSARIPIYALLIAFVVPSTVVFGFLNLQALVFMGMYLLGVIAALGSAYILHKILKTTDTSFLSLDLPEYKIPYWKNVLMEVSNKVQAFVFGAGKVIIVISILLWFAASYGPNLANKKIQFAQEAAQMNLSEQESSEYIASKTLENSYVGIAGRVIEPIIKPIGFDWKIGIAIITSFAAREVFIGTMSTLYSIGEDAGESTIREKLGKQINPETKQRVFTVATSLSLLVFYAFALQCMSTMAVVYRETKTWKYPIYQFIGMGLFAYIASFIVYHLFK